MRVYSRVCGLLTPTWHVRMPHRFSVQTQHRHSQLEGRSRRRSLCSAIPGRVFVTPEWLLAHLNDVAIIDVRGEVNTDASALGVERSHYMSLKDVYLESHIPVAPCGSMVFLSESAHR